MDVKKILRWALVLATLALASCATDEPGDMNGDRSDPNSCLNPCEAGQTRCDGSAVQACAADTRGCFSWVAGVDCGDEGAMCDDSVEPAICLTDPGTCQDGAVNQDESDVDCGGQRCMPCDLGGACDSADDCVTNNCDLGVTDACVPEDQVTCTDGAMNQDETDVDCGGATCPACEEGDTCVADADCDSGSCDAGTCAPGAGPCNNGEVQCAGNTVQTCELRQWVETQICAQGCDMGACADEVQCTPMENRCFKNSVQVCNAQGTAWQHLDICNDECDQGLCTGSCEPNALRCNGDVQEACAMDGQTWAQAEDCTLGCSHRVCAENELANQGVPMTMSGAHVYRDCVTIELGGSIEVPADETLEIWAKCLNVTSSSYVTLNSNSRFIFHAKETIVNEGSIAGGAFVRLDAYQSLTNSGDVSSQRVELRGDVLENAAGGTIGGSDSYALYGSEWTNDGTHEGSESVMPPGTLSSPTHPQGYQWNMVADDVSIAWDKPFASVKGYYINVNAQQLPSPSDGEFTTVENVTLPLRLFRPGSNTVRVVSVNNDSSVGTVAAEFEINFNVTSPNVTSTSHTDPFEWSSSDDVFLEWTDASSVDPDSYVGYWYAWDHRGDTMPDETIGIFRNDDKILFDNQASGVWTFHIVSIDRLGRTSPTPGRYEIRVGPEPGFGNVAGNITDANGEPLRGATVLLNGGVYRATSVASGDYTFRGEVPATAFDWDVEVRAPGFVPQVQTVRMTASASEVMDFQLAEDNQPAAYELRYPVLLDSQYSADANAEFDIALGRPNEVIWSTPSRTRISSTAGATLLNLSASSYYGERIETGYDGNHYFATNVQYCSSSNYCPRFQLYDSVHERVTSRSISSWGTMYGPSVVWDGAKFVVVGVRSYLRFGSIDPNDADNESAVAETSFSGSSSSARTKALFDGSAIAVATSSYSSPDYYPHLARYTRDGAEVLAPVRLSEPMNYSQPIGLAYDGEQYHVTFKGSERKGNNKYPLYLQTIDQAGNLGKLTELDDDTDSSYAPMVAFDGRNLLVVFEAENEGVLEVRDPTTHAVIDTFSLGQIRNPNIDFAFHAGKGAIIYMSPSTDRGTYMREIVVE